MAKIPKKQLESMGGTIVHNLPFPLDTSSEALA